MIPPLAAAPIGDGPPPTSTPRDSRFADSLAGALAVADVLAAAAATAVPSPVGADATSITTTIAAAEGTAADADPTASAEGDVAQTDIDGPDDSQPAGSAQGVGPAGAWAAPSPAEPAVAAPAVAPPTAGAPTASSGPTPTEGVAAPATPATEPAPPATADAEPTPDAPRAPRMEGPRAGLQPRDARRPDAQSSPIDAERLPQAEIERGPGLTGADAPTRTDDSRPSPDGHRSVVPPSPATPFTGTAAATAASGPPATGPGSSAAAAATDTVRYLRELGPARAVQRLAVDLDGTTVAVRIDHSGVTPTVHVHVLDDPAGRLDPSWTTGVERTLAQTLGRDHQPGGDRRDRRPHEDPPNDETHAPAARRWADALTGVRP